MPVKKGAKLMRKKEFLAGEGLVGVHSVPHLGDVLGQAIGPVDAGPLSDGLVGRREKLVVVRLADHWQIDGLETCLLKHTSKRL